MNEVRMRCPECDERYLFPPGTSVNNMSCLQCGGLLTAARAATPARSPVIVVSPAASMAPAAAGPRVPADSIIGVDALLADRQGETTFSAPWSVWLAWLLFIGLAGGMVLFQGWASPAARELWLPYYVGLRNALVVMAGLWVIYDAWQEGLAQGLLCLLIPPYLLLYAIAKPESYLLRALVFGLLVGIVTEGWLMPGASLLTGFGPALQGLIESVNSTLAAVKRV